MTWDAWIDRYRRLFGFDKDDELAMLDEWARLFDRRGFTAEEMDHAADEVAANPPRYRSDHLRALQEAVHARRADEVARRSASHAGSPPDASCALCGGSGWASVPHPHRTYRDRGATFAVFCHCPTGCRMELAFEPTKQMQRDNWRPISLAEYEREWVPRWREIVATQQAERRARARTRSLDESLGEIRRKFGLMPPSPQPRRPVPPGNVPPAG